MLLKPTLKIPGEQLLSDPARQPLTLSLLTLALSLGVGVLIAQDHMTLVILGLGALVGLVLVLRPMLAFYFLIPVSMLGEFQEIPGSPLDLAQLIGLTVIAGVLLQVLIGKTVLRRSVLDLPILLLIAAHLAGLRSDSFDQSTLSQLFSLFSILVAYSMCFQLLDSATKLHKALLVFVGSVTVIDLLGLYSLALGEPTLQLFGRQLSLFGNWGNEGRLGGFFEQPNTFGQLVILALPVCVAMTIAPTTRARFAWIALAVVNAVALLLSQSRSAILGAAIAVLVVLFFVSKQHLMKRLVLGGLLVLASLALTDFVGLLPTVLDRLSLSSLFAEQADAYLYLGRSLTFSKGVEIFFNYPLGVGLGQGSIMLGGLLGVAERSVHNVLLSWAVDLGVLGLLAGAWLLCAQVGSLWSLTIKLADQPVRALSAGLLGAIIATWLHNLLHSTLVWLPVWIIFAIASAVIGLYTAKKPLAAEEAKREPALFEQSITPPASAAS